MNTAGKNCTKRDPEKYDWSPQCTLHRTKNRSQSCNVKKLYKEQFPLWHHYIIHSVVDAYRRGFTIIWSKSVINDLTIGKVTDNQKCQTQNKTDHLNPSLYCNSQLSYFCQSMADQLTIHSA